jgi:phage tail protein X
MNKRYNSIPSFRDPQGRPYVGTTKYPDIPYSYEDIYVYTTEGDRFDILAYQYYGDASLWWVISTANPNTLQNSMYPPVGIQIRIPKDIGGILSRYNSLNSI